MFLGFRVDLLWGKEDEPGCEMVAQVPFWLCCMSTYHTKVDTFADKSRLWLMLAQS